MAQITVSVHDVVDLLLRTGDIDNRIFNQGTMKKGTEVHKKYQKALGSDAQEEVFVRTSFACELDIITVQGYIDDVITDGKTHQFRILEFKSTVDDLDNFHKNNEQWHLGQAQFYAYMYSLQYAKQDNITIELIYIDQKDTDNYKMYTYTFNADELKMIVNEYINNYHKFIKLILQFKEDRNLTTREITFPFAEKRDGQQQMIDFICDNYSIKKRVFINAPTGIGKTVGVIYPLLFKFYTDNLNKIYYLTSKNNIKDVAMSGLKLFTDNQVKIKAIKVSGKDNICPFGKDGKCDPLHCKKAIGYYDKLLECLKRALNEQYLFTNEYVIDFCSENNLCPYQFQLDLEKYCDVVVCDYNHIFDLHSPFFNRTNDFIKTSNNILAVDEAHNLNERVRDSYSVEITKDNIKKVFNQCKSSQCAKLRMLLDSLLLNFTLTSFEESDVNNDDDQLETNIKIEDFPPALFNELKVIQNEISSILYRNIKTGYDDFVDFYYLLSDFFGIIDYAKNSDTTKSFRICYIKDEKSKDLISIKLWCLDSTEIIRNTTEHFAYNIFFSGTLIPINYQIKMLSGDNSDLSCALSLKTPFPKENTLAIIDGAYTFNYERRDAMIPYLCGYINNVVLSKHGNYLICCPALEFAAKLYKALSERFHNKFDIFLQPHNMSDSDKKIFLSHFERENKKTTLGIVTLGGSFTEGVDYIGDKLVGSIVISIGLPKPSVENDERIAYYNEKENDITMGKEYIYQNVGLLKTIQAAGRVIRTEYDKGIIIFMDSRFRADKFYSVISSIYPNVKTCSRDRKPFPYIEDFWKEK